MYFIFICVPLDFLFCDAGAILYSKKERGGGGIRLAVVSEQEGWPVLYLSLYLPPLSLLQVNYGSRGVRRYIRVQSIGPVLFLFSL